MKRLKQLLGVLGVIVEVVAKAIDLYNKIR